MEDREDDFSPSGLIRQMLTEEGIVPMVDEPECTLWKAAHPSCYGCKHELACAKLVSIMLLQFQSMMYKPASLQESLAVSAELAKRTNGIIAAAAIEEIHRIAEGGAI